MVQALRMPMLGNTMETGLLAEWHVGEGDAVAADQVVAVVESEKAAADVVANRDGTLARIDVEAGEEVPPGTLVGVVLGPDEDVSDAPPPRSRVEPGGKGAERAGEPEESEEAEEAKETPPEQASAEAPESGSEADAEPSTGGAPATSDAASSTDGTDRTGRAFVPPSTRRLARELGVDVRSLVGTGTGGRVTESDVRRAAGVVGTEAGSGGHQKTTPAGRPEAGGIAGPPPRDPSRFGVTVAEERALSGVRRTVAERMSRSTREAPQVTLNRDVAVERAFETAGELADAGDGEVGFVDLLVGATVRALERHPEFNAWYEGETHRMIEEVNVAVAVDAEMGLLTPVIREASGRTLAGIARERRRLTDAVLEGRHGLDDLQGGTFTVSNLGPLGVDSFDPILDPPQVAILGVGRVVEGTCTLSLTFDHRVVDGADAARFLDTLTDGLESPSVVVAERAAAGAGTEHSGDVSETANEVGSGPDAGSKAETPSRESTVRSGHESVAATVASDLTDRAREVATAHDWPVPEFEVRLSGDRPTVTVHAEEGGDASRATYRRLTYAACRESRYADTIVGLRDPDIELA